MADYLSTAYTPTSTDPHDNQTLVWGNKFVPLSDVTVDRISWYLTGTGTYPRRIQIWDETSTPLVNVAVTVTGTGAGWHTQTITPTNLLAGHAYWVTISETAADAISIVNTGWATGAPPADNHYQHGGAWFYNALSGGIAKPDTQSSWQMAGVIIGDGLGYAGGTGTVPNGGATPADVENKLADWLVSTSDNTHQSDGLPWLTKAQLDTVAGQVSTVETSVGAGLGVNVSSVLSTVGSIITIVQAIRDLGAGTAIKSAFDNIGTAISGAVTSIETALGLSVSTPPKTVSSFPTGTGTLLWTMANETDWDTELAWSVPADLYVCTITSVPSGVGADTFAGVTWYHRLGSWAPLNGDQVAGPRAFLEFSPQQLQQNGARMPGLALRCKQGTLGHVQAWVLA